MFKNTSTVTTHPSATYSEYHEGLEAIRHVLLRNSLVTLLDNSSADREILRTSVSPMWVSHNGHNSVPYMPLRPLQSAPGTSQVNISELVITNFITNSVSETSNTDFIGAPLPTNFPQNTTDFPIPANSSCVLSYKVQKGDTCNSISRDNGIRPDKLLEMYPKLCNQLAIGEMLCLKGIALTGLSSTRYATMPTPTTSPLSSAAATTTASPPSTDCTRTYSVKTGDTCFAIAAENNLSLKEFLILNTGLRVGDDRDCPLLAGKSVCIQGVTDSLDSMTDHSHNIPQSQTQSTPTTFSAHTGSWLVPTSLEVIPIHTKEHTEENA